MFMDTTQASYIFKKSGTVFKPETGKLYVFEKNCVQVLVAWPQPKAWEKTLCKYPNWVRFRPSLAWLKCIELPVTDPGQPLLPGITEHELYDSPWFKWYTTIPAEIRAELSRFRSHKWEMLSFFAYCGKPALELARSNPALAFALANCRIFRTKKLSHPMRSIRAQLKHRQKDILTWLGFPGTTSCREILRKIPHHAISVTGLIQLRDAMNDGSMSKILQHCTWKNWKSLMLLRPEFYDFLSVPLIEELSNMSNEHEDQFFNGSEWKNAFQHFIDVARMYCQVSPRPTIKRIADYRQLVEYHDALFLRLNIEECSSFPFPAPPFPGTAGIIPITDYRELVWEGKTQRNCAKSYADAITRGNSTLYRMDKPERCTLEIRRHPSGRWTLAQIKAFANSDASPEAIAAAKQWLMESGK